MYDEILNEALRAVIKDFDSGHVSLETEGDLRGHLFRRCAEILSHRGHPLPIPIHAETPIGKGPHKRDEPTPDLTIGPHAETVAELKFEPFTTDASQRVYPGDVGYDIKKLKAWARQGHKGHFIMIELEGETTTGDWYFRSHVASLIPEKRWHDADAGHFTWVHQTVSPQK